MLSAAANEKDGGGRDGGGLKKDGLCLSNTANVVNRVSIVKKNQGVCLMQQFQHVMPLTPSIH